MLQRPDPAGETIFGNQHYAVDYFSTQTVTPNRPIVITFANLGERRLHGTGFAGDFLLSNGFDVIAVKSAVDRWYQDAPGDLFEAITQFISSGPTRSRRRATFGVSMSGYAAMMFAKRLAVDIVFAIAPQFDINAAWDTRLASYRFGPMRVANGDTADSACRYVVLYDPWDIDRLHIAEFTKFFPTWCLSRLGVPFAGPRPADTLAEAGLMNKIALKILTGGKVNRRDIAKTVHATNRYKYFLGTACLDRGHVGWAESIIGRALAEMPMESENNLKAAQIAARRGDSARAVTLAATAVTLEPENPYMNFLLGTYLREQRVHQRALHYVNQAIALLPEEAAFVAERESLVREMEGG